MSLINKMLNDLEKRDAFLYEKENTVLDGLYSAYDIELNEKRKQRAFIIPLLSFLVLTLLVAATYYLYSNSLDQTSPVLINELSQQDDLKDAKSKPFPLALKNSVIKNEASHFLKLDNNLLIEPDSTKQEISISKTDALNQIDNIYFETNEQGINLVMKMPKDIDYLVYGLQNPNRVVVEINDAKLGFLLEDLEPVAPIVAIRYSINKQNRFKLVLESEQLLSISKSTTGKGERYHDLVVTMKQQWQRNDLKENNNELLANIVDQQVNEEKEIVFKGELIKTPVNKNANAYADKLFKQAYADYKNGDISNSLKRLNAALDHDAAHINARSTLAMVLASQGHTGLAYSILNEGLIQYPKQTEWIKMYARLLLNEEKVVQAKDLLVKYTPEFSSHVDYYALLSAILQKLNEHNESARIYRDLLQLNPTNSVWWMGLGISLESLKRYEDALYAYQKAYKSPTLVSSSRDFLTQRINMLNKLIKDEST